MMTLVNAKDRPVNAPGVLDMSGALLNLFQQIKLFLVTQEIINFQLEETLTPLAFQGVLQPMKARQVMMKPEGQRTWRWATLHTQVGVTLNLNDIVWIGNVKFRVMERWAWEHYGYLEFHLTQDWQDRSTAPPLPESVFQKFAGSVVMSGTNVSVDISASITDARKALWKLYDSTGKEVLLAVTITSSTHVTVGSTPQLPNGTYKLIGEA